ncbi:MAG: SYNERG-CTERM sorting domain-containing protein, partial [Synergistaceae bacterium]|nr:SYNERG-CTERM sorting domain-containing protein [Synergistaceae bacterium]
DGVSSLNVLAYFARADVTYVQYLTAEAETEAEPEAEPEQKKSGSSRGGCDVGLGVLSLAVALPLLWRRKSRG